MHSSDVGPRLTEASHGAYFRLAEPGSYTVRALRVGYEEQSRQASVGGSGWTDADFALLPTLTGAPAGVAGPADWFRHANPLRAGERVLLTPPPSAGAASVDLLDVRGRLVSRLAGGLAPGREHALSLPAGLAAGTYLLHARSGRLESTARLIYLP